MMRVIAFRIKSLFARENVNLITNAALRVFAFGIHESICMCECRADCERSMMKVTAFGIMSLLVCENAELIMNVT